MCDSRIGDMIERSLERMRLDDVMFVLGVVRSVLEHSIKKKKEERLCQDEKRRRNLNSK